MKNIVTILKKIDAHFLRKNARKISEDDIRKVSAKADEIEEKFRKNGPLDRFIEDGKLMLSFVRDYRSGKYRKIPYWVVAAIAFTLLYILTPFDAIFDMIPGVGQLDDAAVMGICLYMVEKELHLYKTWKSN